MRVIKSYKITQVGVRLDSLARNSIYDLRKVHVICGSNEDEREHIYI